MFFPAAAHDEFRAAAAHIQQQQRMPRSSGRSSRLERPTGFPRAGNDFRLRPDARRMVSVKSAGFIASRAALVQDADGAEFFRARSGRIPRRPRGAAIVRAGAGAFRRSPVQPRLPALSCTDALRAPHVGDQQLDRIGADINDGAADGSMSGEVTRHRAQADRKMLHSRTLLLARGRLDFPVNLYFAAWIAVDPARTVTKTIPNAR